MTDGQGICLGQMLAEAICERKNSEPDLDRYEAQRRPIAQGVVTLTHRITLLATLKSFLLCRLRDWRIWTVMSFSIVRGRIMSRIAELPL